MVKPSTFTGLKDHLPALYIAAPVLKKRGGPQIPFIDYADGAIAWWDPNMAETIYLYGGGWAAEIVSPPGVKDNPVTSGPLNQNLLPNQSNYNASSKTPMKVGDFLFFHPQQSDAISQFEEIVVIRKNRIVGRWKSFEIKY